ncbi:hypothetical protein G6F24_015059 [Rhizopus arrhizus]|nr:hypothetical protein G6F24_015059 [Rhizopus arrhizus]
MQVTDITTSLISGQPAWMVAIQQGGQLKDQFGGIGPAARAVSGYVLGLINPLTLTAAALAALAIAAKQSEDQLFDFQKAQILSGQGAAIGAAGFLELANSIDHLQGVSRGGAVAALTETAKAGRFAGEHFEMVAAAAARMEDSTGAGGGPAAAQRCRAVPDRRAAAAQHDAARGGEVAGSRQRGDQDLCLPPGRRG